MEKRNKNPKEVAQHLNGEANINCALAVHDYSKKCTLYQFDRNVHSGSHKDSRIHALKQNLYTF